MRGLIPNPNIPTKSQDEAHFESRDLKIDEHDVKLMVWDTSGRPEQKSSVIELMKNKNSVMAIFDVTNAESFDTAKEWIATARANMEEKIGIILIGNKTDIAAKCEDKRQVEKSDAKQYAKDNGVHYAEISAYTTSRQKLQRVFERLVKYAHAASTG